jgi:isoleucyl-tRNA synthetase
MFRPVESSVSFPKQEEEIVRFWKQKRVYEKSLKARAGCPSFVFFEGPPTANGLPHPGHCLTRAIKDLFPRYRTMRGYLCQRKAGWDTHGLPVEVEVCKELGIHSKEEIETFGVEPFIHRCLESVFRYTKEWEELTERLGFWIHLDEAYVTYHQSYVESVWWALKNLFDRGLLYQGHKIVWWWAQGGTALSSGEVGQGYREVADPSVYVRFPLVNKLPLPPGEGRGEGDSQADLLVWTTTPWTLSSNQFAAVKPDLEYSVVCLEGDSRSLVVASALVETIAAKVGKKAQVVSTCMGRELIGLRYVPPFDHFYKTDGQRQGMLKAGGRQHVAWRVVPADFVTIDTGSGIVHQAPAFGEVDFDVLLSEQARFVDGDGPALICSVAPDGTFTADAPEYQGRWVKDADRDIIRWLRDEGILLHQEQYLHDYPFCWRADEDPLIQYPRKSWFIRTTQFKEKMLANNRRINWLPEHIRDGRFGNFLETNVDWALSRERYWGTPLPIWVCQETGFMEAVGSYKELLGKRGVKGTEVWEEAKKANPSLPDDLKVHKPYIDAITYDSPKAKGARMRRVPEVIDCWFDSGAMPFAQWGYPGTRGSKQRLAAQFPADFISEALDQTRGWFYSLLAISTLLFGEEEYPHPFRNCIVLGLMLAEWWESPDGKQRFLSEAEARAACGEKVAHKVGKMSKQLRNYRAPSEIFDQYGADALRWYLFANQAPWNSIIYSEKAIKENIPEFLLRLWNVYSFFVIYANIDGFDPAAALDGDAGQLTPDVLARAEGYRPIAERGELDRWILSELGRTAATVVERMDAYDNYAACGRLTEFLDALSNWYVRRSRDRFWSGGQSAAKTDAHWTLYECLTTTCKLIAPFVPFVSEAIWQNLAVAAFGAKRAAQSVHLCDYPTGRAEAIDQDLSARMALAREIVSQGRAARMGAKLKVRQPLARVEVVLGDATHRAWLEEHAALIAEELNVKQVEFIQKADQYITYNVLPDLKRLGPRLGKRLPALRKLLAEADAAELLARMEADHQVTFEVPDGPAVLDSADLQVRMQARPGWAAAQGRACVVVLSTELSPELIDEGLAREVVHAVQNVRKDKDCQYTDRIVIGVVTESGPLRTALERFRDYLMAETLAVELRSEALPGVEPVELNLAGESVALYVKATQQEPAP